MFKEIHHISWGGRPKVGALANIERRYAAHCLFHEDGSESLTRDLHGIRHIQTKPVFCCFIRRDMANPSFRFVVHLR